MYKATQPEKANLKSTDLLLVYQRVFMVRGLIPINEAEDALL
jgi:hypothetical protein